MAIKDIKKVSLTLSVGEEWRALATRRVEIPVIIDEDASVTVNMQTFSESMSRLFSDFEGIKRTLSPVNYIPLLMEASTASDVKRAVDTEAAKHAEGGDVWRIQNRANELATENECLKKQVKDLIAQLDKNIERGE